jgi:hypothetical protein
MRKTDYVDKTDRGFGRQMSGFRDTIGQYATVLGLTEAELAAQAADANYFNYVLACHEATHRHAQEWTAWKKLILDGQAAPDTVLPTAPVMPAPVPAVPAGIKARFRALARKIKAQGSYNPALGEGVGIEAGMVTPPDWSKLKPKLSLSISADHVLVHWDWQGYRRFLDSCEIHVNRGPGFVLLTMDTTPGFLDPESFPATPAKWTYRAVFRVGDASVGLWSDSISIAVG